MDVMAEDEAKTPFEAIGGEAGVRALVERFYTLMSERPDARDIRAMHAADLAPMVDRLTTYLVGWMGGPRRYTERFGPVIVPAAHRAFAIGERERDAWLACFAQALAERGLSDRWQAAIMAPMRTMADMCRTDAR